MIEFDPRYLSSVLVIIGVVAGFWYKIKRTEEELKTLKKIIFKETGGLNVVVHETCNSNIGRINEKIKRESDITAKALDKLEALNENIIIIMTHMNIKPRQKKQLIYDDQQDEQHDT